MKWGDFIGKAPNNVPTIICLLRKLLTLEWSVAIEGTYSKRSTHYTLNINPYKSPENNFASTKSMLSSTF